MVDMERRIEASDERRSSELHKRLNSMPAEIVASMVNNQKLGELLKKP